MPPRPSSLRWEHLGLIGYQDAFQRQLDHHAGVLAGHLPPGLFTLEHHPVITLGRRAREEHLHLPRHELERRGLEVIETDRGGEATWHGPGQLTIYAVVPLQPLGIGASDLVRTLAGAVRTTLEHRGLDAHWDDAHPGLWVDGRKICAVGMRIRRGVSLHGAAVNVSNDLDAWSLFVPCGMPGAPSTSIAHEGLTPPTIEALGEEVAHRIAEALNLELVRA